jgi:hypothetical protein
MSIPHPRSFWNKHKNELELLKDVLFGALKIK